MAQLVYATTTQLEGYLAADPPADAPRLLVRASNVFRSYLKTFRYATDATGMPTDQDVLDAFADCVCAQIEWWMSNNDELNELGQVDSYSFEGISYTGTRQSSLAPRALERLALLSSSQFSPSITV